MVFFTCNACGESLKKGQVEKHTSMCRNCKCLSCIDCGKDFWGDEYKTHLKCITEDQKYGGKGFEAKAHKGDLKQQQWIQRISEAMNRPNINPKLKNILNQLSAYENIPRKKAKFQNWMKNSIKIYEQTLHDQVWEIVSQAGDSQNKAASNDAPKPSDAAAADSKPEATETTGEPEKKKSKRERKEERQAKNKKEKKDLSTEEPEENGTKKKGKKRKVEEESKGSDDEETIEEASTEKKKKKKQSYEDQEPVPQKKKKRNHEEPEEEQQEEEPGEDPAEEEEDSAQKGKFNWKGTIKALLRQAPDNELPIKKLRKKVIAQYYATSSDQHKSEEEILATFNKKIKSNPKFRLLKENVKLIK